MDVLCVVNVLVIVPVLYFRDGYVGGCVNVGLHEFQCRQYGEVLVRRSGSRSDCLVVENILESTCVMSRKVAPC